MQSISNPKTLRGKKRRLQANLDAQFFTDSKGFNGCSTSTVTSAKLKGAHHKKLYMERKVKTYKPFSLV